MNPFLSRLVYRLMYIFSRPNWDTGTTPPYVLQAFTQGDVPPGSALDLGCGTGTNVIYMAQQGRTAIGIDFAREAIVKARQKAAQAGVTDKTQFYVADVSRLDRLNLPTISFALDMGCFHGLTPEEQRRYMEGLSTLMCPGGWFMLYVVEPRQEAGIGYGMTLDAVRQVVSPWFQITRTEHDDYWRRGATWFWMKRSENGK